MPDLASVGPLLAAVCYYGTVLGTAEISRRILDRTVSKKSSFHRFLIELIGTAQICTCVFENAVIVQHYGVSSFFIVTSVLGFLFSTTSRGSYGTPLSPMELLYYGEIRLSRFLMLLLAEMLGGALAWHVAKALWFHSLQYSQAHMEMFVNSQNMCTITHKRDFMFALAFEVTGCFTMRLVLPRLPSNVARYLAPAFIASLFSFAIVFIGDAGLDPVVASTLFFGCNGLSAQWFILLYWICPVVGWMLGAHFGRQPQKSPKRLKRTTKKKLE
ncbi:unnamed protein product [Heligmosomoides polygyrus]|uniref:Aquaporin n=1 Tax=Heligmosomoides polygyrus TaxID=6339 RepID=A0A3P8BWF4_HELPZ|nr:unnamed protein product [Heligmosomoides polygyrus]